MARRLTLQGAWAVATVTSLTLLPACASRRAVPALRAELGAADALVQQGCYGCLEDALGIYERVAAGPPFIPEATRGAFRTAVLLLLRAKELGLPQEPAQRRAESWAERVMPPPVVARVPVEPTPAQYLAAAHLVHGELSGLMPEERERLSRDRRAAWPADGTVPAARSALSPFVGSDMLAQYIAVAVDCEDARARQAVNHADVLARYPYPLMRFRLTLCGIRALAFEPIRQGDPRWVDTFFFEGRHEMTRGPAIDVGRAAELFAAAHAAFPGSVAITLALGNARNALEEHEPALALFDRILAESPTHRDALLGRLLSLSYLKRHYDAIRAATRMVDLGTYHMGDAYYWRAWNRYQVHELPAAWSDVEHASKLMVNTAVHTLAGFIAYAQRELAVAVDRLDRAYRLDRTNCEAVWTEGMVHVDTQDWALASARFILAVDCFAADAQAARESIAVTEASAWAAAVKVRRIATAQKRAETSEHRRAQSAFNAASSYLRLARKADALGQIGIAAAHPLLKDKAAALRAAIEKLPEELR